jgi:hypothetical protein
MEAPVEAYEFDFTKAQLRHFNELQTAVQRAQAALQSFADYLAEEYELSAVDLPPGYQWQIGPKGFRAAPNGGNPLAAGESQIAPEALSGLQPTANSQQPLAAMQNGAGG